MLECTLRSRRDDSFLGTGLGSCSTFESRYRWRQAQRLCPQCRQAAIIKGKQEYGGGWLCFKNKGGCGAKFNDNDPNIISQEVGRVENPDIADAKNTVLKMAKKRAKIDAVIGVTRSAGMFTQDMEDLSHQPIIDVKAVVLDGPTLKQAVEQTIGPAIVAAVEPKVEPSVAQTGPGPEPGPEVVASHAGVKVTAVDKLKSGTNSRGGWNLYVVKFGGAVKASDGQNANSATTLDEKVAAQAEDYRSSGALVLPVLEPGNKRGSYNVTKFDLPVSR
jgi:hypothetical protein